MEIKDGSPFCQTCKRNKRSCKHSQLLDPRVQQGEPSQDELVRPVPAEDVGPQISQVH